MGQPLIKFLTGAPLSDRLSWDEQSLSSDWVQPIRSFLSTRGFLAGDLDRSFWTGSAPVDSCWRSIPLSSQNNLHTGYTQATGQGIWPDPARSSIHPEDESLLYDQPSPTSTIPDDDDFDDLPGSSFGGPDDGDDSETRFLEHSVAVHDDLQSSQLELSPLEETTILPSFRTTVSFRTTATSSFGSTDFLSNVDESDLFAAVDSHNEARLPRYITNLRDIPDARHLRSIVPQTIVVSIVAGVISILPPRSIRTRHGQLKDLVELLVGDETATGFKIAFWFPHQESQPHDRAATTDDPLRTALQELRIQDAIVVENVALDIFKEKVFGYSLRKSMQKNQTRVQLLARNGVDRAAGLEGIEKVQSVKEWIYRLVNPPSGAPGGDVIAEPGVMRKAPLPPDTQ